MNRPILLALALLMALGSPFAAHAGCTASLNCGNGCFASVEECPPPYRPYSFSCSAPSQQLQCTGNSSCNVGSNYVECDSSRQTCSTQCFQGSTFADCGSTHLSCQQCQTHAISCML
jgi:hypothetical protein